MQLAEINDTDDGEESNEERESSIYDEYYFEMKRSQARPNVITHVCVLSVIVHGPYGLMRNGIRDFFRDKLRPYMPSDGHIKWSHSGTKLRIILANYQPEEKTNVLSVLDKLITDGSDFHYVEKCDISFQHDALTPECVLTSIATPTRRERSRTMSSYASEGDKCHNEKCLVTHGITRLCKKCRSVKYCSRKCLKADADRHGLVCKPCSPGKPIGKPNSPRK